MIRKSLIILAVAAIAGCHRAAPSKPTAAPAGEPDFSAIYEVQSIRPGDYSQYVVTLERPNKPNPDGSIPVGTWMELKTFMQDDLKAALEPGTSIAPFPATITAMARSP